MLRDVSDKGRLWRVLLYSFLLLIPLGMLQFIIALLFDLAGLEAENSLWVLRISVVLQDLFVMALPAYLVFKQSFKRPVAALGMYKRPDMKQMLFVAFLLYIITTPLISVTGNWNQQLQFPTALKGLEASFRAMEDQAEKIYDMMFGSTNAFNLVMNIIIVAGLAALVEEILFRGALQQLLHRITGNAHSAVWISAVVFSAIHMQFYGFVPRIIMGAVMGYLFIITKNLWVPIFYHFINNAIAVVMKTYMDNNAVIKQMEEFKPNLWHWLMAAVSLWFTYRLLKQMYLRFGTTATYQTELKPMPQPATPLANKETAATPNETEN